MVRCIRSPQERIRIARRAIELKEKYGLETKDIASILEISYSGLKSVLRWYKERKP